MQPGRALAARGLADVRLDDLAGAESCPERAVSRVLARHRVEEGKQRSLLIGSWTPINADTSQARLLTTVTWNVRST